MADLPAARERLQPALLDRLTDDEPDKAVEVREQRVMSKARLRQAVLRDLEWLFNTTRLESGASLAALPYVRRSVVNYGLPVFSGQTASTLEISDLERAITQAILDFEPRILPQSLQVKALVQSSAFDHHNVIGVEIQGQLWAQPVPLEMLIRTEIELETGKVRLPDVDAPRVT
jgi:type VI secretion system protein ImpF